MTFEDFLTDAGYEAQAKWAEAGLVIIRAFSPSITNIVTPESLGQFLSEWLETATRANMAMVLAMMSDYHEWNERR